MLIIYRRQLKRGCLERSNPLGLDRTQLGSGWPSSELDEFQVIAVPHKSYQARPAAYQRDMHGRLELPSGDRAARSFKVLPVGAGDICPPVEQVARPHRTARHAKRGAARH
jgi:hypothetical protein